MSAAEDTQPTLDERKRALDAKLKAKLHANMYDSVREMLGRDALKFIALAMLMKRELWAEFFELYCEVMGKGAGDFLDVMEREDADSANKPKTIFD